LIELYSAFVGLSNNATSFSETGERVKGGKYRCFFRGQRWSAGVYRLATRSSLPEQLKQQK